MYNNPILWTDPKGGTEEERKKAVSHGRKYIQENAGYSYGAKGAPGQPVDCSGLVSGCIVSSGLTNPVGLGTGTGVNQIMEASTKIQTVNDIQVGNAVIIDWNAGGGNSHIGLISEVIRDSDGKVTSYKFIHSSSSKGPTENTVNIGGKGYYDGGRITGWYKWDSPDPVSLPLAEEEQGKVGELGMWDSFVNSVKQHWAVIKFFTADRTSSSTNESAIINKYKVIAAGLNVRNSAGGGNDKWVTPLKRGDEVIATGNIEGTWMEVQVGDKTGWISSKEQFVEKVN